MDVDGGGEAEAVSSKQVQVRFVTKLKPPSKAPQASISIPANLTRFGLSALVNNLLQAGTFYFWVSLYLNIYFFYDFGWIWQKLS